MLTSPAAAFLFEEGCSWPQPVRNLASQEENPGAGWKNDLWNGALSEKPAGYKMKGESRTTLKLNR